MRIAFCIHNSKDSTHLQMLLKRYSEQNKVLFSYQFFKNSIELLCNLKGGEYDVVFLDLSHNISQLIYDIREKDKQVRLIPIVTAVQRGDQSYGKDIWYSLPSPVSETLFNFVLIQCIAYGLAFFSSTALTLFTLILWRSVKDKVSLWFGLLSCFFSMYMSYYFVNLLNLPLQQYFYLIQSLSLYGLSICVIRLTILIGETDNKKSSIWLQRVLILMSALLLLIATLIPILHWAIWLHSILTNFYYIFTFCALLFLMINSKAQLTWEYRLSLLGCTIFGLGLLLNLFTSNLFEPILFFWQFEWCGLFLIIMFGAVMVTKNKRIVSENTMYSEHLENLVENRTESLLKLLRERKAFFADMAHDLKAPIFATNSFIQAIRKNDTGVDSELKSYIDQVEKKQKEM